MPFQIPLSKVEVVEEELEVRAITPCPEHSSVEDDMSESTSSLPDELMAGQSKVTSMIFVAFFID